MSESVILERLATLEAFEKLYEWRENERRSMRALLAACGFREPMKRTRRGRRRARGHNLGLVTIKFGRGR
jgi:hypothetical protein